MRLSWEKAARRTVEPGPSSTLPTAHIAILQQWDARFESSVYHLAFHRLPHEIDAKRAIKQAFVKQGSLASRLKAANRLHVGFGLPNQE